MVAGAMSSSGRGVGGGPGLSGFGYDTSGLRFGALAHQEAGAAAGRMASVLAAATVAAGAFGRVRAAAGFAAAVEVVRETQGRAAGAEAAARVGTAARVRSTADQGDELTATTTAVAQMPRPGAIVAALGG